MFDILVNGNVVAVVVKALVKPFVETLVKMLPEEGLSIQTREHTEPEEDSKKKESK